jgi:hypothetical protein
MDILVIIIIVAVTSLILYKGTKRNQKQTPAQVSTHVPWMQIGLYVASQTVIMILLFFFRGTGKSLSNGAFHAFIVIAIIGVGTIACLSLHHRRAKAKSWVLLFSVASFLNILIWEITTAIPE